MMLSSANSPSWLDFKCSGKSFIYTRKRTGPRTVPCGTPEVTGAISDDSPSRTSLMFHSRFHKIRVCIEVVDVELCQSPSLVSLNIII